MTPLAQWLAAFAALLLGGAGVGALIRIGAGSGIFFAGAATMLWSLTYIRLGGPKTRIGRAIDGKPLWGDDRHLRHQELTRGFSVFGMGAALWAALAAGYATGVVA